MHAELAAGIAAALQQLASLAGSREACALLAGWVSRECVSVTAAHPLPNFAARGDRFCIDPIQALRQIDACRRRGLVEVGWFHSHPHGPAHPSVLDARHTWPGMLVVIAGCGGSDQAQLACYWPEQGRLRSVPHQLRDQRTMSINSISNTNVELPGIFGGLPISP